MADILRSPRESLTRGQHFVRHSIELTVHCGRQLQLHRADGMAAELTYRTIFSLIPVVVLGLVMFRIFGGLDEVQSQVENQLYSFFGVPDIPEEYDAPPIESSLTDENLTDRSATGDGTAAGDGVGGANQFNGGNSSTEANSNTGSSAPSPPDLAAESGPTSPSSAPDASARTTSGVAPAIANDELVDMKQAIEASSPGVPIGGSLNEMVIGADEEIEAASAAVEAAVEAEVDAKTVQRTRATIRSTLHDVTMKVSQLDFKSMGVFGLLLFVYAAVALANSAESIFNRIYDAPSHRPLHLRLAIHWSIITLGSGLLTLSLYTSSQVVDWVAEFSDVSSSKQILNHLLSVLASWILLFLLYALMPNTHVSVRAAAIGSLVGSLFWEGAKFGFQIYVVKAVPYSALYGSIGLIPLFLFWIYLTWLIILFGLILTYTLQMLQGRPIRRIEVEDGISTAGDPDWMLPIAWEVSFAFESGDMIDDQTLAERLGLPTHLVRQMTSKLSEAGLLRRVQAASGEQESLTLGRPADKIQVGEILSLAHQVRPTGEHPAWKTLERLQQAEREAVDGQTLKDVMTGEV